MTFPVKKRINTELFIDGDRGFIYKIDKVDQIRRIRSRNAGPLGRGQNKKAGN